MAVVGALLVVATAGLLLGGGGEPSAEAPPDERSDRVSDPTRRPAPTSTAPPTTTTTAVAAPGPVFGQPVGASVLLASATGNRWVWLDLDTGERRDLEFVIREPYALAAVRGGVVEVNGGEARYRPLPDGELVTLGPADQVVPGSEPGTVWLLEHEFDGPSLLTSRAVLVDLSGRRRSRTVDLRGAYPIGASGGGLVFSRGGRTYLVDERGVRPIAEGEARRTNARSVVVVSCDDQAECAPAIVDVSTGAVRRLAPLPTPPELGVTVLISDEGDRLAVLSYRGEGATLAVYDDDGRPIGSLGQLVAQAEPRWLPENLGLVAVLAEGGVVRVVADAGEMRAEPIPALAGARGAYLYVIPR